jgi:hypothetical protein
MPENGEKLRTYMAELGLHNYIVLAQDSSTESFSLANGNGEMLVSLMTMFYKDNPELLVQVVATILKIFQDVTPEQLLENAKKIQEGGCDCDNCRAKRKGEGGSVDINDFIAKGKLH